LEVVDFFRFGASAIRLIFYFRVVLFRLGDAGLLLGGWDVLGRCSLGRGMGIGLVEGAYEELVPPRSRLLR